MKEKCVCVGKILKFFFKEWLIKKRYRKKRKLNNKIKRERKILKRKKTSQGKCLLQSRWKHTRRESQTRSTHTMCAPFA